MQAYKLLAEVSARLSSYVSEVNAWRMISCIHWQSIPFSPVFSQATLSGIQARRSQDPTTCKQANRANFYERHACNDNSSDGSCAMKMPRVSRNSLSDAKKHPKKAVLFPFPNLSPKFSATGGSSGLQATVL
jgi:hypothetical protein